MVITVVMADAARQVAEADVSALLYADDTLVIGTDAKAVERYLEAIRQVGLRYGWELHGSKFQLLQVGPQQRIRKHDGSIIETNDRLTYLGAIITPDGRGGPELLRRLGMATCDFRELSRF